MRGVILSEEVDMNKIITALLPMKGHSERVPNKNICLLGNKPLFFHILNLQVK